MSAGNFALEKVDGSFTVEELSDNSLLGPIVSFHFENLSVVLVE